MQNVYGLQDLHRIHLFCGLRLESYSRIKTKKDGWTVVTRDKKLSAQWEHTVAVTANGFEVLTLRDDEQSRIR